MYKKSDSAGALVQRQIETIPALSAQRASQELARRNARQQYPEMIQYARPQYGPPQYGEFPSPYQAPMGDLAEIRHELARMRSMLQAPLGGPVHPADYERGIAAYADPKSVMSGGILQSSAAAVPAASAIGFTATATVTGEDLARLSGTQWIYCSVVTTGILSDPEEAAKCVITATVNGGRINTLYRTPLDPLITNLMGQPAMTPVRVMIPSTAIVSFEVEVVTAALSVGNAATVVFRLFAGDEEQWAHLVSRAR